MKGFIMAVKQIVRPVLMVLAGFGVALDAYADWVMLRDGTRIEDCYVRDEGVRLLVWEDMTDVGTERVRVVPRWELADTERPFKVERDPAIWDKQPPLPDLTITHIELSPRLPGLHGKVPYDKWGRPKIAGSSRFHELEGEAAYMEPETIVGDVKFRYEPGQEITMIAHVRNIGFATAKPFSYVWMIDDEELACGKYDKPCAEMEIVKFEQKWRWKDGFHHVTFRIEAFEPEIATINNALKDPLWGFALTYVVSSGRAAAWHDFRSAYGTFSFEDFYRWHIDIMNLLFEKSVYPSTPNGIRARVRLDRLIYADKVQNNVPWVDGKEAPLGRDDGLRYDQGGWFWNDSDEELTTGKWIQVNPEWRNATEWSLPHELGHQLGLVDWYALDFPGGDRHVAADNGEPIAHFMRHPVMMMHWHGPQVYGEVDAAYLDQTWDKPRGYFGDMYFAMPRECYLKVVDINGEGVPGALVEIFQRGTKLDPDGKPAVDHGVKYFPVIEDGDFYSEQVQQVTKQPVIVGTTDDDGLLRLPNRPVKEVRTLNGYHRRPNPFGNMNVVGQRQLMMVRVTEHDQPCHFFLEGHDFVAAWYRGHKERYTTRLQTPYGSVDSPPPPADVRVTRVDEHHARVSWSRPDIGGEYNATYLQQPIGYRVYRRIGNDGLSDRPWFSVGTVGPETFELVIDLRDQPKDYYWFSKVNRIAVSTLAGTSRQSALSTAVVLE